ncbi:MAG: GNAT family N-acetyltransferase [Ignavibacteriales bacterium]|nr:GNAT family N-acetyltransferase [Ignavibacteriales bacterium]
MPTSDITIRDWKLEDLPAVRQLTWDTWLDTYSSFIPIEDMQAYFDEHYTLQDMEQLLYSQSVRCAVAELDGVIVGFGRTQYNEHERRIYLSSLYIHPNHQGKGIGRHLLQAAESRAESLGLDEIWLGVMIQNVDALAWYRKLGFVFEREEPFVMGKTSVQHLIGFEKIRKAM